MRTIAIICNYEEWYPWSDWLYNSNFKPQIHDHWGW